MVLGWREFRGWLPVESEHKCACSEADTLTQLKLDSFRLTENSLLSGRESCVQSLQRSIGEGHSSFQAV